MAIRFDDQFAPRGFRPSTEFIVHHTTAGSSSGSPEDVVRFHMETRGWRSCGYHFLIDAAGTVTPTLHRNAIGAHVGDIGFGRLKMNSRSIGISWIGGLSHDDRTAAQKEALLSLTAKLVDFWPTAEVLGHRDLIARFGAKTAKACPWYDAGPWWAANRARLMGEEPAENPPVVEKAGTEDLPDDAPGAPPVLFRGSRGGAVKDLQRRLGMADWQVDGIFGSGTQAAVRAFQTGKGLTADGIVGPKTWAALG